MSSLTTGICRARCVSDGKHVPVVSDRHSVYDFRFKRAETSVLS